MSKWQTFRDADHVMENDNRRRILETIKSNPGIHFRGVCAALSMQIGVTQYHLQTLEKFGLVKSQKDGKFMRYYERNDVTGEKTMAILATSTRRIEKEIMAMLVSGVDARKTFKEVSRSTGVSMPAVTWHVNRMKKVGLLKNNSSLVEGIASEYSALCEKGLMLQKGRYVSRTCGGGS